MPEEVMVCDLGNFLLVALSHITLTLVFGQEKKHCFGLSDGFASRLRLQVRRSGIPLGSIRSVTVPLKLKQT